MSEKYVKLRTFSHEITKGILRQTSIFGDIVFSIILFIHSNLSNTSTREID